MTTINQFNDATSRALVDVVRDRRRNSKKRTGTVAFNATDNTSLILKTPSGGIPGRTGDTCDSAECIVIVMGADGVLAEATTRTGDPREVQVFNMSTEDVAGDTYIQAKLVGVRYMVDWEDC